MVVDSSSSHSSPADDYDYVSLESKAKFDQENEEVKRNLPQDMKRGFDVLVAQSEDLPVLPTTNDQVRNMAGFDGLDPKESLSNTSSYLFQQKFK